MTLRIIPNLLQTWCLDDVRFEDFCKAHGTEVLIINNEALSPQEEMTQDLLSIIHCFSSRLYGLRKYKSDIKKIVKAS